MIIANKFEIPDRCPKDCQFTDDIKNFGQSGICIRCPVMVCKEPTTKEEENYMPIVQAYDYRPDWAKEWENFFKDGTYPKLKL